MNITLRPSGGRGEYELAGSQGNLHVTDLLGRPIFIEILPGVSINAHSKCLNSDGKPRIRLDSKVKNAHPSSLIAAAMMLPKPRRKRRDTEGVDLLQREQFVVQTIRIDVVLRSGDVLICPIVVRLENEVGIHLDISFTERMARVLRAWAGAATATGILADAVRAHATAFTSATSTQTELVRSFAALFSALGKPSGDILPLIEARLGVVSISGQSIGEISAQIDDDDFAENILTDPADARIDRVRTWRLAAVRGGSSAIFRNNVREAYDSRCMFSGQRLPRTAATSTAGVDAAHILPWSRFNLDTTSNGICLNKQCHWAFDEGFFRLSYDDDINAYVISIPNPVRLAAEAAQFEIETYIAMSGPVAPERLPANQLMWPSRIYLSELNQILDGESG